MKRPSFQFYPGDWLRSTDLRSCSIGARGLWIDMLCLMHEGSPYGFLKVGSKVILPETLARMVGCTLVEVEGWLKELKEAGVCSIESDCFVSRRMIRDENIRAKRAAGGHLGGNPKLVNKLQKVAERITSEVIQNPTPSSASASAKVRESKDSPAYAPDFLEFWAIYPKKEGKHDAFKAYNRAIKGGTQHGIIIAATRAFRERIEREGTERRYVPGAEKWINGRRWEDEVITRTGRSASARDADLFSAGDSAQRSNPSSPKRSKWDIEAERLAAEYRAEAQRERQGTSNAGPRENLPASTPVRENGS